MVMIMVKELGETTFLVEGREVALSLVGTSRIEVKSFRRIGWESETQLKLHPCKLSNANASNSNQSRRVSNKKKRTKAGDIRIYI